MALLNSGQHQEAGNVLSRALAQVQVAGASAAIAQLQYYLGLALQQQGLIDQAIASYDEALRLQPQDQQINHARINKGFLFYSRKEHNKAMAAFADAITIDPSNAAAHKNLGGLKANSGAVEEAARSFQQAAALGDQEAQRQLSQLQKGWGAPG